MLTISSLRVLTSDAQLREVAETMVSTIMHFSDLHLGNDFIPRAIVTLRPWWKRVDQRITDGLKTAIRGLHPDLIVVSGDIVNKARGRNFRVAASYLRNLFLNSGFDMNERLLIVPGNHDVSFFPGRHADDFRRLRLYREFLRELFSESDTETKRQRFVRTDPAARLIFVCLDSTLKGKVPLAEGEVGLGQQNWMKTKLNKLRSDLSMYHNCVKIIVLHHHCVPIAGISASGERFMQLLDAGDVLKLFDEMGVNVVLHGHKHTPHVTPRVRSDSSVLTVVGAGTTTCCFLEEQAGEGNNFNLLTVSPETNELTIQLYRANDNGQFVPVSDPKKFPLFRIEKLGYSAQCVRKAVHVLKDGTIKVSLAKEGLRVEAPGKEIRTLPLRIISTAVGSKIDDFNYDNTHTGLRLIAKSDSVIEGEWVLRRPMRHGDTPISITYSYAVKNGTAMCQSDVAKLYPAGMDRERTVALLTNPTTTLKMEVTFPEQFPTVPRVNVSHLGSEIPTDMLTCEFTHDKFLNRCELKVSNPPLDHSFSIEWTLPVAWP